MITGGYVYFDKTSSEARVFGEEQNEGDVSNFGTTSLKITSTGVSRLKNICFEEY
jgi:hypothetical protein